MVYLQTGSKDFLILIQPPGVEGCAFPIKAIIRKVALRQCGHWMMGRARIYNHTIPLSGAYGAGWIGVQCAHGRIYARSGIPPLLAVP